MPIPRPPIVAVAFADTQAISARFELPNLSALLSFPVDALRDGQACYVLGYAEEGDGGGGLFRFSAESEGDENGGTVFALVAGAGRWRRVVDGPINVRWFGAIGDGVANDHAAIQAAIDAGYSLGAGEIFVPAGIYKTDKPLFLYGGNHYTTRGMALVGEGSTCTKIKKTATTTLGSGNGNYGATDAVILLGNADKNSANATYGQSISNITIGDFVENGAADCDFGIVALGDCAKLVLSGITIHGKKCFQATNNMWQCSFRNLLMYPTVSGFLMLTSGTSNMLDTCFVYGATQYAYNLRGDYSSANSLAADACTGEVYWFAFGNWSVNGLGCESPEATKVLHVTNSATVAINSLGVYRLTNAAGTIIAINGSYLTINGGAFLGSGNNAGQNMHLYTQAFVTLRDIELPTANVADANDDAANRIDYRSRLNNSVLGTRYNSTYPTFRNIGDRSELSANGGVAVIINTQGPPSSWGEVLQFRKGDVFLSKDPLADGCLGHVCTVSGTSTVAPGTFAKIPYSITGTTAQRPATNRTAGQSYYDTTIGKPVWWNGTNWTDAAGNSV